MRFLRVLCVLAMVASLTAAAYAATQSVKVSGDLAVRGILRNNYDYQGSPTEPDVTRTGLSSAQQNWLMSTAEVQVDADLTDNVQTVIRLVNQRDWNVRTKSIASTTTLATNGLGGYTANTDEFQVALDLAYVTLKDFIYSPLTLTIGRQNLWLGKGFVVGANQQNPGTNLSAPEYTAINSFDAVKAVLDYDPWKITGIYSKITENAVQDSDDVDLYAVNVGYKFDSYKAEAEGYWVYKKDDSIEKWGGIKSENDVHTIGLRGSLDPLDVLTLSLEGAYQGGTFVGNRLQINNRPRSAYALDAAAELRILMDKFAWKPKIGAEYILYSGDKTTSNSAAAAGDYTGWDPMYRGKFDSAIREFVGRYYATARYPANPNRTQTYADAAFTNQQQFIVRGSLQPIESLALAANYNVFWNLEDYDVAVAKSGGIIGHEIDLQATWDYTEDVSFGLLAGWFIPGEVYYDNRNDIATDIVGTVKVSF